MYDQIRTQLMPVNWTCVFQVRKQFLTLDLDHHFRGVGGLSGARGGPRDCRLVGVVLVFLVFFFELMKSCVSFTISTVRLILYDIKAASVLFGYKTIISLA
jgi:hypothetical protein